MGQPTLARVDFLQLPNGCVLEFTTTLNNRIVLHMSQRNPRHPMRFVDVAEAPITFGPCVAMYVLPIDATKTPGSAHDRYRLLRRIVSVGDVVFLVDTLDMPNEPVKPFVVKTVNFG